MNIIGELGDIPKELVEYLHTLITPPKGETLIILDFEQVDWAQYGDEQVHGLIYAGNPTPYFDEMWRVLKPGAHVVGFPPEKEPTNHTAACGLEDTGFEIRDQICWVVEEGDLHYVPKASSSERNAGVVGRNVHPCLHPDDLVMTDFGYRPIGELKTGHRVLSVDGRFHSIEDVTRHSYTSPALFEISVQGTNYTTRASDNHPFLIWRPTRNRNNITGGEVLWVEAQDIRKGDYTLRPSLRGDVPRHVPEKYQEDEIFWFLFGLYLAEGVLQKSGHGSSVYPSYTLHEKEKHLVELIQDFTLPLNVGVYPKKEAKAVQVMAFDKELGSAFQRLGGSGASTKTIHPAIWGLHPLLKKEVLDGYLAGDGCTVRNYQQAKTVSPDLASQFLVLAESIGYRTTLHRYEEKPGKVGDRQIKRVLPVHYLRLYSEDPNKQQSKPEQIEFEGVPCLLSYVKAVEELPYEGEVVNLTVRDSPTFQTAIGMSHNTVKPIGIFEKLLEDVPLEETVVDPFVGSGTTGIACLRTGHSAILIDREREYLEIADRRIRHWDRAEAGWDHADIVSEVEPEESEGPEEMSLDDLFEFDME